MSREGEPAKPTSGDRQTLQQSEAQIATSADLSSPRELSNNPEAPWILGYVLTVKIGEGAHGQVWRAWQKRTGKEVAVKVFLRKSGLDWLFLQREVERLARLDKHPNVVTLLDTDFEHDPPCYAMELVTAGTLADYVHPDRIVSEKQAIEWMRQIAEALAYIHGKGLIHCDLKPGNVLIDEQGRLRVADFGQSRIFTEASGALGTLFYMAPEQAVVTDERNQSHPDVRWDIYALGATMYALLTATAPHESAANSCQLENAVTLEQRLAAYRRMVQQGQLTTGLRASGPPIGRELSAVVLKCLSPNPDRRYSSAAALHADLTALVQGRPVSPLAANRTYRLRKFLQRHRGGAIAAAAIAFAVVATVGYFYASHKILIQRLEHLNKQAVGYTNSGEWSLASQTFEEILRLDLNNLYGLVDYARMKKEHYNDRPDKPATLLQEGISLLDRALELEPGDWTAVNNKGVLLRMLGRTKEAEALLRKGLQSNPGLYDRISLLGNLSVVLAMEGPMDQAESFAQETVDAYRQFLHEGPKELIVHIRPLGVEIYRNLAAIQLHLRKGSAADSLEAAENCCEKADSATQLLKARAYLQLPEHFDPGYAIEAAKIAEFLETKKPKKISDRIKRILALAHLELGQWENAKLNAQLALSAGDMAAINHLILALAEAHSGNSGAVHDHLHEAEISWPEVLKDRGSFTADAPEGVLWFEDAEELFGLRSQLTIPKPGATGAERR